MEVAAEDLVTEKRFEFDDDLARIVKDVAARSQLTTEQVAGRALLNRRLIVEQRAKGRRFEVKDKAQRVAEVGFA